MSIGTTHSKSETRVRCLSQDTLRAGTSRALQVRARERVHFGLIARRWVAIREANSSRVKTRAAMVVVTEFVTDDRSGARHFLRSGPPTSSLSRSRPRYGQLQRKQEKAQFVLRLAPEDPFTQRPLPEHMEDHEQPTFTAGPDRSCIGVLAFPSCRKCR